MPESSLPISSLPIDPLALQLEHYPHRYCVETRSSDSSDWRGHIPNGQITRFGDDARLGLHQAIMGDGEPRIFKLVEMQFRFFHELLFPGTVMIGVGIVGIGRSSLRQVAGFFRDGRCHVRAECVVVKAVDGASVPMSAEERERAGAFLISSPASARA